ncbi:MAG: hypothetical protein K2N78_12585, partial [Oscillospiraceae bacterium]|nr:hypothetical protein [Oscillospiraceae bacterium]
MAYNEEKLTRLKGLRQLAQRIEANYASKKFVAEQIAAADHLIRKKVDSLDEIDLTATDAGRYIYMVPKTGGKNGDKYDEYMVLDGVLEPVGDWKVDLSGYVEKEEGKGLSANDYTDEDKAKLDGIADGATKVEATEKAGVISINDEDVTLFEVATYAEVDEMLNEVFGAPSNKSNFVEFYGVTLSGNSGKIEFSTENYDFTVTVKNTDTVDDVVVKCNQMARNVGLI